MARNKSRDDKLFNCSQQHEIDYVTSLYPKEYRKDIKEFIELNCALGVFDNSTHKYVYNSIEERFGITQED